MQIAARSRLVLILMVACISLVGAACGSEDDTTPEGDDGGSGAASVTVTAADFAFDPDQVSVDEAGTVSVTLQNDDDTQHSLTISDADFEIVADGGATASGDLEIADGDSFAFQCKFHSSMTGTIAVGDAAGGQPAPEGEDDSYNY